MIRSSVPCPAASFNFWMDPEATRVVLHAPWPRLVLTTVDISVKTGMEQSLADALRGSPTPAAQYVAKYAQGSYLWDELAAVAWLDPTLVTKRSTLFVDVSLDRGATYGETLAWAPRDQRGWASVRWKCRWTWTRTGSTASSWTCSRGPRRDIPRTGSEPFTARRGGAAL
jgi:inosine-uridine nucleoside N-ribohydrolase